MTSSVHLLEQALMLANKGKRPRSTDLKRAVSTTYYALFHAICERCADMLVGAKNRKTNYWINAYRSLDHGHGRKEFKRISQEEKRGALMFVADLFVDLQEQRHFADYDPRPSQLSRVGVIALIKQADAAISAFPTIDNAKWLEVATALMLRGRR